MISVGSTLPEFTFSRLVGHDMENPHTNEIFGGKKVVMFAVPGAFTPTCSNSHLPGFVQHYDELMAKGVDSIVCISVNDAFVMNAWGKDQNVGDIIMLSDGNGDFSQMIGVDMNTAQFGGLRSQRYAMIVDDGVVTHFYLEDPGHFEESSVENILKQL
jgi:peroxiredoxin